jgi:hypothetical protein
MAYGNIELENPLYYGPIDSDILSNLLVLFKNYIQ